MMPPLLSYFGRLPLMRQDQRPAVGPAPALARVAEAIAIGCRTPCSSMLPSVIGGPGGSCCFAMAIDLHHLARPDQPRNSDRVLRQVKSLSHARRINEPFSSECTLRIMTCGRWPFRRVPHLLCCQGLNTRPAREHGGDHMAEFARSSSDKMPGAGYAFLVISIVLGMAAGGSGAFPLLAGIAMLVLASLMYLMGK
jgi:hypothetical protein